MAESEVCAQAADAPPRGQAGQLELRQGREAEQMAKGETRRCAGQDRKEKYAGMHDGLMARGVPANP